MVKYTDNGHTQINTHTYLGKVSAVVSILSVSETHEQRTHTHSTRTTDIHTHLGKVSVVIALHLVVEHFALLGIGIRDQLILEEMKKKKMRKENEKRREENKTRIDEKRVKTHR